MATCKPRIDFNKPNFEYDAGDAVLRFCEAVDELNHANFQMQQAERIVDAAREELNRYFPNGYTVSCQLPNRYAEPPESPDLPPLF